MSSTAPRAFELAAESDDRQQNEMQADFVPTENAAIVSGNGGELETTAEATKLLFTPGRDLLPPVRVNLLTAMEPEEIPTATPTPTELEAAHVSTEMTAEAPTATTTDETPILPPPASADLKPIPPAPSVRGPYLDAPLVPKNPLVAVPADQQSGLAVIGYGDRFAEWDGEQRPRICLTRFAGRSTNSAALT